MHLQGLGLVKPGHAQKTLVVDPGVADEFWLVQHNRTQIDVANPQVREARRKLFRRVYLLESRPRQIPPHPLIPRAIGLLQRDKPTLTENSAPLTVRTHY